MWRLCGLLRGSVLSNSAKEKRWLTHLWISWGGGDGMGTSKKNGGWSSHAECWMMKMKGKDKSLLKRQEIIAQLTWCQCLVLRNCPHYIICVWLSSLMFSSRQSVEVEMEKHFPHTPHGLKTRFQVPPKWRDGWVSANLLCNWIASFWLLMMLSSGKRMSARDGASQLSWARPWKNLRPEKTDTDFQEFWSIQDPRLLAYGQCKSELDY